MNKRIKLAVLLGSLLFLAAACNRNLAPGEDYSRANGVISGHALTVQIAQSAPAQELGLSGRDSLGENEAMYFGFPQAGQYPFWMKDMKFALDFIWVREGKIVEITANVLPEPGVPEASLRIYRPQEAVDGNFEVNAGWAAKNQVKVGDTAELTK